MTTTEFVSLEKSLLTELSNLAVKGRLMFIPPAAPILRGINFEGSSFDKTSFSVTMFVMLLCVPTKHLNLSFAAGVRHKKGGDRWNSEMPELIKELSSALKAQAIPFLSPVQSLLDFVDLARSRSFSDNPQTLRAEAFALARAGQISRAVGALDQLLNQIDSKIGWQLEIADQARALRSKLVASSSEAERQLEVWEVETVRNLGLEDFR
jgi:hypothetical protein